MKRRIWIAWIALAGVAACSDANVAGDYNAQLTNGNDGCSLGLTTGTNAAADFTVTQSGSDVTLEVRGIPAAFLALQVGVAVLTGGVDGDEMVVARQGTLTKTDMGCEYTINARIEATVEGDAMSGRVEYRAATNNHADCGSRTGCLTVQTFNATRPPAPAQ